MEFGDDVVSYVIIMSLVLFCTHRVVMCNLKTSAVLAAIKPKNFSSNVHFFFKLYIPSYKTGRWTEGDRERESDKATTQYGRLKVTFLCSRLYIAIHIKALSEHATNHSARRTTVENCSEMCTFLKPG